jgi:hypothetical protein
MTLVVTVTLPSTLDKVEMISSTAFLPLLAGAFTSMKPEYWSEPPVALVSNWMKNLDPADASDTNILWTSGILLEEVVTVCTSGLTKAEDVIV